MSTAPVIDDNMPPTWAGQLTTLLEQCKDLSTRVEAKANLERMAKVAELYIADHPAEDGHTNARALLRESLQAYLDGDVRAFSRLLHLARLADMYDGSRVG